MKFTSVNQFHSGTAIGDAITGDMLEIQRVLRADGWQSEIYAEYIAPGLQEKVLPVVDYPGDPGALLIVHHSFGFRLFDKIISLPDRKLLRYHNITPIEFMDRDLGTYSAQGRQQLRDYVPHIELAIGDSEYNRSELIDCGYRYTSAIPIFFRPPSLLHEPPDTATLGNLLGAFNLLFVGRIAVNKRQDELIRIFGEYFHKYNGDARLWLVGKAEGNEMTDRYAEGMRRSISQLGLGDAAVLTGKVSDAQLAAYYRASNVLVCTSEHEGFCVPLLEAMAFDLPIVAFSAAAVPETLGGSGVLLDRKDPELWCEVIEQLRLDDEFRETVLRSQRERLEQLSVQRSGAKLLDIVNGLSTGGPLHCSRPTLQIQGPFETSYSLASINRNLALALDDEGTFDVSIHCTEGPGDYIPDERNLQAKPRAKWLWEKSRLLNGNPDVTIRNLYPPRVEDVQGTANFLYFFWEDSLISKKWVDQFNRFLDAVFVPSQHVDKVLTESGVSIPLHLLHPGVEDRFLCRQVLPKTDNHFRFFHVSSGFPRKGIDVLLEAYFTEFTASDSVSLLIKTFPNIHNQVSRQISEWRVRTPNAPECTHIDEDASEDELDKLYDSAHCMVYPTRCEGFGLPIAEAMARRIPVIATAYSGHMDFCSEQNAFLVGYDLARSASHLNTGDSKWAEPKLMDLRQRMRFVFDNRDSQIVRDKVEAAYQLMSTKFRWPMTAHNCAHAISESVKRKEKSILRIAMVTSWDARCGIAEYTRYLLEAAVAKRPNWYFEVLSSATEGVWATSPVPYQVRWKHRDWRLKLGLKSLCNSDIDVVHFQFNFAFFELPDLAETIRCLKQHGKVVLITFHSTADVNENGSRRSLVTIAKELKQCDALLVHSVEDQERLASYGIASNVRLIPHGNVLFPIEESSSALRQSLKVPFAPVVGTFGFLLPHKGVLELVEATNLLRAQFPNVGMVGQCARHNVGFFAEYETRVKARIKELGLDSRVLLSTEFVQPAEAAMILQLCDVIVLPYTENAESSSAAVRFALAAGRPVITTAQPIFQDVANVTYQIASSNPREIVGAIHNVLDDPILYDSLSRKARERAEAGSWNRVAEEYLHILESVLKTDPRELETETQPEGATGESCAAAPAVLSDCWPVSFSAPTLASCTEVRPTSIPDLPRNLPQLSELTNPDKWDNTEWMRVHQELETYSLDKHCFSTTKDLAYRKGWEWTQALYGLERLGVVTPRAKALGVGAGREPLLFYLADRIESVIGTDLYGNPMWSRDSGREADDSLLRETRQFCPRSFEFSRLQLLPMDGTRLEFPDNGFDFVWSLSSIEHFGGHEAARKSMREMARVTRPGGIVVVATEFILNQTDGKHPEYFTREDFEQYIVGASEDLKLIQPVNYSPPGKIYFDDKVLIHTPDIHRKRHHIILSDGRFEWTSVVVFFIKESRGKRALNKVCEIEDFRQPHLAPYPIHRKNWEYEQFMNGLEELGAINAQAVVLAVGAGHEPPIYKLANSCKQVHATDLYGVSEFSGAEANPSMLVNPDQFSPFPYKRKRLVVQYMDALDLRYEDNSFDIVFSLSSIEHFGGIEQAKRSLSEMSRVCRPGGIVAFTTELVVNGAPHLSEPHLELFTPETLKEVLDSCQDLSLVDELSVSVSCKTLETSLPLNEVLTSKKQHLPHIVLERNGRQFTSVLLFLRKQKPAAAINESIAS